MYIKLAIFAAKNWKKILPIILGVVLLIIMIPAFIISLFAPGGKDEDIQKYVEVANNLSIPWKDLVAFDMVKYKNDLENKDPNESAYYFITLHYEEYTAAKTVCKKYDQKNKCIEQVEEPEKVTKSQDIVGKDDIKSFFKKQGFTGNDITNNIIQINSTQGKRVIVSSISTEEAMDNANFTKKEKSHFDNILEFGLIDKLYGQYDDVGMIPGTCIDNISPEGKAKVNSKVESYTGLITKYAKKEGLEPYVEWLKAMMMQESKGNGTDPMQSSESGHNTKYCDSRNCIQDPEYSIQVGVETFAEVIEKANGDMMLAVQSYNFGPYFLTWVKDHGGKYTKEVAQLYSDSYLYPQHGMRGNPEHAIDVLKYYLNPGCEVGSVSPGAIGSNGWVWPTKSTRVTEYFGADRGDHLHLAIDIGATKPGVAGDPIMAIADGVVIQSGLITRGGNSVFIDHGNGVVSRSIHMQSRNVKTGQIVKKGQVIGLMGGTGGTQTQLQYDAYPVHLDFQLKINGNPVDPLKYYPSIK